MLRLIPLCVTMLAPTFHQPGQAGVPASDLTPATFRLMTNDVQERKLLQAVMIAPELQPAGIVAVVREALQDDSDSVRVLALKILRTLAGPTRYARHGGRRMEADLTSHQVGLERELSPLLESPNEQVRHLTVDTLVLLAPESGNPALLAKLAEMLESDPSALVRGTIIGSLRAFTPQGADLKRHVLKALSDESDIVVYEAVRTVGHLRMSDVLPKIAPLLQHDDAKLRSAAALAIGRNGRAAAPYLPRLQERLGEERDGSVRREMERAVSTIRAAEGQAVVRQP